MSSDLRQMLRSWELVAEEMKARHPKQLDNIRLGRTYFLRWLVDRALAQGRYGEARYFMILLAQNNDSTVLSIAARIAIERVRPRRLFAGLMRHLQFGRFPFGISDLQRI